MTVRFCLACGRTAYEAEVGRDEPQKYGCSGCFQAPENCKCEPLKVQKEGNMKYQVAIHRRIRGTDEIFAEPLKAFLYQSPERAEAVCNALVDTLKALGMLASFMVTVDEYQTGQILRRERV